MTATSLEWQIAVHEAGHAVIGIDEGQTIERAFLIRDANQQVCRGETHAPTWPAIRDVGHAGEDEIRECSRLARELLAGMHAVWELDQKAHPGAAEDLNQLACLAECMFNDTTLRAKWTARMNNEVQPLIKERWEAITAVAANLLVKEQSRAEIECTMRAHPPGSLSG